MILGKLLEKDIISYELKNDYIRVKILNYGGIIQELSIFNGTEWDNVILAYDDIKEYFNSTYYFGCVTGRTAGRIKGAEFELNKKKYVLDKNNGNNNLHGGNKGLDKRIWECESHDNQQIILTYNSPDGEEGFPGNVVFKLTYRIESNSFFWNIQAVTDMDTPINITNHTYFNLSSSQEPAINHQLFLNADYFCPTSSTNEISGGLSSVEGTPFDFRIAKHISRDIYSDNEQLNYGHGYDHCFVLKDNTTPIDLYDSSINKGVKIFTNQKACVFYSGNFLEKSDKKLTIGVPVSKRLGICLETQNIPDGVDGIILRANEVYYNENEWRFYSK